MQLNTIEKEKDSIVQQLQTTLSQLHAKLDKRVFKNNTNFTFKRLFLFLGKVYSTIIYRYSS